LGGQLKRADLNRLCQKQGGSGPERPPFGKGLEERLFENSPRPKRQEKRAVLGQWQVGPLPLKRHAGNLVFAKRAALTNL